MLLECYKEIYGGNARFKLLKNIGLQKFNLTVIIMVKINNYNFEIHMKNVQWKETLTKVQKYVLNIIVYYYVRMHWINNFQYFVAYLQLFQRSRYKSITCTN